MLLKKLLPLTGAFLYLLNSFQIMPLLDLGDISAWLFHASIIQIKESEHETFFIN